LRRQGILAQIEEQVDKDMEPQNIKVETQVDGKWVKMDNDIFNSRDFTAGEEHKFNEIIDHVLETKGKKTGYKLKL
jgi:hypothetical protein